MKMFRILLITLLISVVIFPASCFAMTQDEWNEECRTKTAGTTTLYSLEKNGESVELIEIGSLPGGTYFKTGEYDYDLCMWHITYFVNGKKATGWIHRDNLVMATKEVFLNDGSAIIVTEAVYKNKTALQKEINRLAPGRSLYGDGSKPIASDGALPPTDVIDDPEALQQWAEDYAKDRVNTPTRTDSKSTKSISQTTTPTGNVSTIRWTPNADISDEERAFIATCSQQVNKTVTGYSDAAMTKASGTIKGGTLCKLIDESGEVARISYYANGTAQTAYIKRSDLYGAYTQYKQEDGTVHTVYIGDPDYAKIIEGREITYLAESLQKGIEAESTDADVLFVQLVRLGAATSTVMIDGEEREVATDELSFGSTAPEGKELAVIYAPNTGKASLRDKASEKGKLLKTTKAGTLVQVLEVGSTWSKIVYKDTVGYIKTACLHFHEAGEATQGTAKISYNGKTNGSTTVNIRNAPKGDSAKIAEWRTGTPVTVFGLEKGWYEVEAQGIRGYVMEEFLTVDE